MKIILFSSDSTPSSIDESTRLAETNKNETIKVEHEAQIKVFMAIVEKKVKN